MNQTCTKSPMAHFTPDNIQAKDRTAHIKKCVGRQDKITQSIYSDLYNNTDLSILLYDESPQARKAASLKISRWATEQIFLPRIYSPDLVKAFKSWPHHQRVASQLKALYKAILLARFIEPGSAKDSIVRAFLDNRSFLETGDWQTDCIAYAKTNVTHHLVDGDPNQNTPVHEVVFAEGALLQIYNYHDEARFLSGSLTPSDQILASAIARIVAAIDNVGKVRAFCDTLKIDINEYAPFLIEQIRKQHSINPLRFARANDILMDVTTLYETLQKQAYYEYRNAQK